MKFAEGLKVFQEAVSWKTDAIDPNIGVVDDRGYCCVGARLAMALDLEVLREDSTAYRKGVEAWATMMGGTPLHAAYMLRQCGAPLNNPFGSDHWDVSPVKVGQLMAKAFEVLPDLRGVDLSDIKLRKMNVQEVDLTEANLREANLLGCDLQGATLERARLNDAVLTDCDLRSVNFNGASLVGVFFNGADMRYATLFEADHTGADFSYADLAETDFTDAIDHLGGE